MPKTFALLFCSLITAGWSPAVACSFCSPVTGHTMLTDLDAADIAFIGELSVPTPVRSDPTAFDLLNQDRQKGEAGFVVRKRLRGTPTVSPGKVITVPLRVPGESGTLHLVTFDESVQRWSTYRLGDDGLKFAIGAASLPTSPSKNPPVRNAVVRLEFCLHFFATEDFLLRKALFSELAQASYTAVRQLRPRLDRDDVHRWLAKATRSAEQTRQLYLLLGLCGDDVDVALLKREFEQCLDSNWAGTLDGIIVAYVSLGGANALDQVDRELLTRRDRSLELKRAAANALKFLVANETNIARPRLLLSCRLLLREPETAELIVRDLAQWEKWQWKGE